jgi:hypothetical protein
MQQYTLDYPSAFLLYSHPEKKNCLMHKPSSAHSNIHAHSAPASDSTSTRKSHRNGIEIVGYTGFIPGKKTGNVFGKTFSSANMAAKSLVNDVRGRNPPASSEYVEKILKMFEKTSPSSQHGNYPIYSTVSTRSSSSRTSSCMDK